MTMPKPIKYLALSVGVALALVEWAIFYRRPWVPPHHRR